jgi:hypothetical protein
MTLMFSRGLGSGSVSNPAARTGRVEATLKCVAARQRKSGIDATT